jgi:hypothetical protein
MRWRPSIFYRSDLQGGRIDLDPQWTDLQGRSQVFLRPFAQRAKSLTCRKAGLRAAGEKIANTGKTILSDSAKLILA